MRVEPARYARSPLSAFGAFFVAVTVLSIACSTGVRIHFPPERLGGAISELAQQCIKKCAWEFKFAIVTRKASEAENHFASCLGRCPGAHVTKGFAQCGERGVPPRALCFEQTTNRSYFWDGVGRGLEGFIGCVLSAGLNAIGIGGGCFPR